MKPDDRTRRIEAARGAATKISTRARSRNRGGRSTGAPANRMGGATSADHAALYAGRGQKTNVKRQQLKEDRTKSFLLLAGLTVVLSLAFFAMFSTPNSRRDSGEGGPIPISAAGEAQRTRMQATR